MLRVTILSNFGEATLIVNITYPFWKQWIESNYHPLGYEPNELPLLYTAIIVWLQGLDLHQQSLASETSELLFSSTLP